MNPAFAIWLRGFLAIHTNMHDASPEALEVQDDAVEAAITVAFDPEEPELPGGRAKSSLTLLAIELHETGLLPRLWRGECHLPKECDGGRATGEFQLHLHDKGIGIELVDAWRYRACFNADAAECVTEQRALGDHALAARVALHFLRANGLQGYTGQGPNGPAVRWIKSVVDGYIAGHPPPRDELPEE